MKNTDENRIPLVSIIMATFNRAHFIGETLASVQKQEYRNWECIIVDDGSNDDTKNVIESFIRKDTRFQYRLRPKQFKKGLSGARNFGLDQAKGDFIIFFDDDDIIHPENLKICIKELESTDIDFCRYDKKPFREVSEITMPKIRDYNSFSFDQYDIDAMVTGRLPFASCTVMWRKRCFNSIRFNEKLEYAEEWECYTRILLTGIKGVSIDQVLYYNKKHKASNTGEFQSKNPVRRESKIRAAHLVLDHLNKSNQITEDINKFFIRLGFDVKDFTIIEKTLKFKNFSSFKILQYLLAFKAYPILKPLLKFKGNIPKLKFI